MLVVVGPVDACVRQEQFGFDPHRRSYEGVADPRRQVHPEVDHAIRIGLEGDLAQGLDQELDLLAGDLG